MIEDFPIQKVSAIQINPNKRYVLFLNTQDGYTWPANRADRAQIEATIIDALVHSGVSKGNISVVFCDGYGVSQVLEVGYDS